VNSHTPLSQEHEVKAFNGSPVSIRGDFVREIVVDANGSVVTYPGLFKQLIFIPTPARPQTPPWKSQARRECVLNHDFG
jgi:hypothetical protein